MEVQKPSDSEHFGEFPQQFLKLKALEEASSSDTVDKDKFTYVKNPNRNDPRRLFQVYKTVFGIVESFNTIRSGSEPFA